MTFNIKQAMTTHLEYAKVDDNLAVTYARMKRENVRHLPVLDVDGVLVGIISNRDIQRAMWPLTTVDAHGYQEEPFFESESIVSEYMSWPVKTLDQGNELLTAVKAMINEKISAVVITRDEQVAGIVTHEDLLRVLAALLQKPETIKERAFALTQHTPLSQITDFLASVGI